MLRSAVVCYRVSLGTHLLWLCYVGRLPLGLVVGVARPGECHLQALPREVYTGKKVVVTKALDGKM